MTRSLPEKTFEHWCSMHLSYRYKAKMLLWWPSAKADINVADIPASWGKQLWLELKTTEWIEKDQAHQLQIDLRQLAAYGKQLVPDYYVFPVPDWEGVLGSTASKKWLGSRVLQRLAYQSHSGSQWFADWTYVVPGHALRSMLQADLQALAPGNSPVVRRVATVRHGGLTWRLGRKAAPPLPMLHWRDFWIHMEKCGDSEWPAQFLLPKPIGQFVDREQLVSILVETAESPSEFSGTVAKYSPAEGNRYRLVPADESDMNLMDMGHTIDNRTNLSHRALVVMSAGALKPY